MSNYFENPEIRINNNGSVPSLEDLILEKCNTKQCKKLINDKFVVGCLAEIRDFDLSTFNHSLETGNVMAYLINNLKGHFTEEEEKKLIASALLHDYGKIELESEIINKKENLSDEDWEKIKKHPRNGYNALKDWDMDVAEFIVAHHEFKEENPYPRESRREGDCKKERLAMILAMVDTFQSMTDPMRPSNKNGVKTIEKIIKELEDNPFFRDKKEVIFLLEQYYYKRKNKSGFVEKNIGNA